MAEPSTRITGNDDAAGADPGGTHSTKPGGAGNTAPALRQTVTSGDRNDGTREKVEGAKPKEP